MNRLTILTLLALAACGTTTEEKVERVQMPDLGNYPPPPPGYKPVRAGIIEFKDKAKGWHWWRWNIGNQASDQFISLVQASKRFRLIERSELDKVVKEQGLKGIVDPDELARPGRVRGVDYLFIGAVTEFQIKVRKEDMGGGIVDRILGGIAPVDIDWSTQEVHVSVGVDIRLVNTTSGEIVTSKTGVVQRTDKASAWGLRVFGIGGDAKNEIEIDEDSCGRVLRWALDTSYREMLKDIDETFSKAAPVTCPNCKVEIEAGAKFCTKCGNSLAPPSCKKCGAELDSGAKFCAKCGTAVEPRK